MSFGDIVGLNEIKQSIIRSVESGRVSHTIMYSGASGSGSLAVAMLHAMYLNCENRGESDVCGSCRSCVKYNNFVHPDHIFIFPFVKSGANKSTIDYLPVWRERLSKSLYFDIDDWISDLDAGNKQPQIYTSEVDYITDKLLKKSFEAEYKVLTIWMPERMNTSVSNKLLKLIEEPPEKTIIQLVTDDENSILPTIKSRCQLIKIPSLQVEDISTNLMVKHKYPKDEAVELARLSEGSYLKTLRLIGNDDVAKMFFEHFQSMMRLAYNRKILDLLTLADKLAQGGRENQLSFLQFSIDMVRENFILNFGDSSLNYIPMQFREWCGKFSKFINEENVIIIYQLLDKASHDIKSNGNSKIIFTHLMLMITKYLRI